MSLASLAESERAALCDLMLELGPDAPTLDEGWAVLDLAAHLVVREHDLWAAPGIVLGGPFAAALGRAMDRRKRQGLDRLVSVVRRGSPIWLRAVPAGAQLNEYYIHHEDVRRPNGLAPRTDRPDLDAGLAKLVRASLSVLLRGKQVGVILMGPGGTEIARHGEEPHAVLTGTPGELLLYLSGRRGAAHVEISGHAGAVAALSEAELSI